MVKLTFITPNAGDVIAYAARFSTATQEDNIDLQKEKDNTALVKKLIKRGHFSCLEFADAMFEIDCSLVCSHQLVRHRHMSFCQKSLRFTVSDNEFIIPPEVENMFQKNEIRQIVGNMQGIYQLLIGKGIKKEDARFFLPVATKTKLVMKGNFRSWIEFLQKRLEKQAQWEIRGIAEEIRDILIEECPVVFENVNFEEVKI